MSTNYYVRVPPCENACAHCSRERDIHLGKSSGGWTFTFRAYPDGDGDQSAPVVTDFASWLALLDLGVIRDEYGVETTRDDLLQLIESKRGGRSELHGIDFLDAGGNRFIPQDFC